MMSYYRQYSNSIESRKRQFIQQNHYSCQKNRYQSKRYEIDPRTNLRQSLQKKSTSLKEWKQQQKIIMKQRDININKISIKINGILDRISQEQKRLKYRNSYKQRENNHQYQQTFNKGYYNIKSSQQYQSFNNHQCLITKNQRYKQSYQFPRQNYLKFNYTQKINEKSQYCDEKQKIYHKQLIVKNQVPENRIKILNQTSKTVVQNLKRQYSVNQLNDYEKTNQKNYRFKTSYEQSEPYQKKDQRKNLTINQPSHYFPINYFHKNQYTLKNGKNIDQEIQKITNKINSIEKEKKYILTQKKNTNNQQFSITINNPQQVKIKDNPQQTQMKYNTSIKTSIYRTKNNQNINPIKQNINNKVITSLINNLIKQFNLDNQLRNAKKWLQYSINQNKWKIIVENLNKKGIIIIQNAIKKIFHLEEQENDPFYSVRIDDQTFQSIVDKFINSKEHWQNKIYKKYKIQELQQNGFLPQIIDRQKKGYVAIQDFIHYINWQSNNYYKIRDIYLTFLRISNNQKLTYKKFLQTFLIQ